MDYCYLEMCSHGWKEDVLILLNDVKESRR